MIRVVCMIRPHRVEAVKTAIASLGVNGLTVADVRGVGNSPERAIAFAGEAHLVALPLRTMIDVVCPDELKEAVVDAILEHAATGQDGDGKIFIEPVEDALRIRTRERGDHGI